MCLLILDLKPSRSQVKGKDSIDRIPESSCVRKETVDTGILVTFKNGDTKIMQSIIENKEMEPAETVQMNIYQSNTYRKNLSWLYFNNEPWVQKSQQVKD